MITTLTKIKDLPYGSFRAYVTKNEKDILSLDEGAVAFVFISPSPKCYYLFVPEPSKTDSD